MLARLGLLIVAAWTATAPAADTAPAATPFALLLEQSVAAEAAPPGAPDQRLTRARQLLGRGEPYPAYVELQALIRETGADLLPAEAVLLAGRAAAAIGLPARAEEYAGQAQALGAKPRDVAQLRLTLADAAHRAGNATECLRQLDASPDRVFGDLALQLVELRARCLLALDRAEDAVAAITAGRNADRQPNYMRLNLAVALLRAGKTEQGRTVLDKLGQVRPRDPQDLAYRDEANLLLGWDFLRAEQGAAAKAILGRVRATGPQSNRALLGLGWAELAPPGKRQKRAMVGDEESTTFDLSRLPRNAVRTMALHGYIDRDLYYVMENRPIPRFKVASLSDQEDAAFKRAMVAWLELQERDAFEPAVWESWLALPFALRGAGAAEQARSHYQLATDRLGKASTGLASALQGVPEFAAILLQDAAALPGQAWELPPRPDTATFAWLDDWLAGYAAQESLRNARVATVMANRTQQRCATAPDAGCAGLADAWRKLAAAEADRFVGDARRELAERGMLLERYRLHAQFALARANDPLLPAGERAPDAPAEESLWERLKRMLSPG